MKTFEEYQFKIKHSQISNVSEEKKIEELEVGDWFYFISRDYYEHCQMTSMTDEPEGGTILYYNGDIDGWFVDPDADFVDDGCTCVNNDGGSWCLTTIPEVAEEWHQKICPQKDVRDFPMD